MAGNVRDNAALLLAAGRSIVEAAREVGVNEKTIRRWKGDAEFRQLIAKLRGELLADGMGKLADSAGAAAEVLKSLLKSESDGIKLAAARSILQVGNDLRKSIEIEAEVEKLREAMEELEATATELSSKESRKGAS